MDLLRCATIATASMGLHEREDFMQDAIEHVLRRGIAERESAYIIRSMKNKIIDIIRSKKKLKRSGVAVEYDVPSEDRYKYFELFGHLRPRSYLVALLVANDGVVGAAETLA